MPIAEGIAALELIAQRHIRQWQNVHVREERRIALIVETQNARDDPLA